MRTEDLREVAEWLLSHDNMAVISHVHPDGDTIGSTLALVFALRQFGKKACPVCTDALGKMYMFLPGADEYADKPAFTPDCWVSVDVSTTQRMGVFEADFVNAAEKIAIDHHESNPGFGNLCYVEPDTAATGEIMLRLIKLMGAEITRDIAELLYTAISTDCGNFSFKNTKPETLVSAAECLKAGADPEKLSRLLFRLRSENTTRMLGAALSRMVLSKGKKVAVITLPDSIYEQYGCTKADSHAFVNYLNEIEGVDIGIFIDETPLGPKASFRAANGANVQLLAEKFGGGGHSAAAGATLKNMTLEEAADVLMRAAVEYVGE